MLDVKNLITGNLTSVFNSVSFYLHRNLQHVSVTTCVGNPDTILCELWDMWAGKTAKCQHILWEHASTRDVWIWSITFNTL